jgi:hypothetical protein
VITVSSNPLPPTPGSVVCITVSGCTTPPVVTATFNTKSLVTRTTSGPNGTYLVCVNLPRGERGIISFSISAGDDYAVKNIVTL